ncbi:hypothetical protein Thini_1758 [Thiothrix nivea DSM 5205]|uniref:Uncharacterized protein n=1 Tax=Thiothrix nivea (strain ATCC 35100 / DSM 5205 / JP2) TaxID=870187 RepID=A0A656HGM0_THINJ|nr:hypothetical protein Thini_1758 [Thiothrix nivea DSM 5205]
MRFSIFTTTHTPGFISEALNSLTAQTFIDR